jgi:very-short-patch-repair endonuclease
MSNPQRTARTADLVRAVGSGPILVRDAISAGVTPGQLRAAVTAGVLMPLRKGIVVPRTDWRDAPDHVRRAWALRAATSAYRGSFGSHDTAGVLWGLPDNRLDAEGDPPTTHISLKGASRRADWIRIHGVDTEPFQVTELHGLPVTSLVRTSIDLAATRSFRSALAVIDAAMRIRAGELSGASLRVAVHDPGVRSALQREWDEAVAPFSRPRWVTTVRRAIRCADPAAESVLESLSRAAMIEGSVPIPRVGVPVVGDDGRTYWVDFLWDEQRLIGEADGLGKYSDISRLVEEKRRQEALEGSGFAVVRWGMAEVLPSPSVMLSRVRRALAQPPRRRD